MLQYIKAEFMCNTCIWRGIIESAFVLLLHIPIVNIFKLFPKVQAIENINQNDICKGVIIHLLAYYYLMFTGMIKPLKHKETQFLKI
jgi:hypothetical protein